MLDCCGVLESVTVTVYGVVAIIPVAVPLILPFAELIDNPVPLNDGLIENVYGVVPLLARTGVNGSGVPTVSAFDDTATVVVNSDAPDVPTPKKNDVEPV